jgi:hypothetical protein
MKYLIENPEAFSHCLLLFFPRTGDKNRAPREIDMSSRAGIFMVPAFLIFYSGFVMIIELVLNSFRYANVPIL